MGKTWLGSRWGRTTGAEAVIDPVLSYSTYLGGNGFDEGDGIAVDGSGAAYVTASPSRQSSRHRTRISQTNPLPTSL